MATERIIKEYRCGFRPNRSTTDQLFVLRQMMEKHYAHSMDLHMLFVDFRNAFDNVNRKRLYEVMKQMEIPDKLIRLIQMTMNTTQAQIKRDNKQRTKFEFNAGVNQGDSLSAVLFIVALRSVIKTTDQRETIFTNQVKYVHIRMTLS
jgi:hypothetical protein